MGCKNQRKIWPYLGIFIFLAMLFTNGCGSQQATLGQQTVDVKAMQVIQRDTPITYEYLGQVTAENEVQIRAKVSGNIVDKMFTGGSTVYAGQPLFQIDRRQYEDALLAAQATLAQSEATLSNAHLDTLRYQKLASQDAIAQQTVDTQLAVEQEDAAVVAANRSQVQEASDNLQDTLIVAPMNGHVDVNDLAVGNFADSGATVLATVSSVDPVFVQFSLSEDEYLKFAKLGNDGSPAAWGNNLTLILSDGSQYPLTGHITEVDHSSLAEDTGTLTLKAVFPNPQQILIPGMFARVEAQGEVLKGALLIPQRAVQQILDKTFVTVVGEGNTAELVPVTMGPRVGSMWVVESGLTAADRVVVDGFMKTPPETVMNVTMIGENDVQ